MEQNKTGERCSVICSIVEGNFCNSIIFCGSHNRGKVGCMRHPLPNWGSRGLLCTVIHGMLTRVEVLIVGSTIRILPLDHFLNVQDFFPLSSVQNWQYSYPVKNYIYLFILK